MRGDPPRACIGQPDVTWVGAGGEAELIFQPAALAREDHVDPGPQIAVGDRAVGGEVALRVISVQVADTAGTGMRRLQLRDNANHVRVLVRWTRRTGLTEIDVDDVTHSAP